MKTIFYKESNTDKGDWWFNDKPYNEWFTLDNYLYEPNGNILKRFVDEKRIIKSVLCQVVNDTFSDTGIIRRIALYISN